MNRKEVIAKLVRNGFNKKKVSRTSDDSLYTLYHIAKRRGELKKGEKNYEKVTIKKNY